MNNPNLFFVKWNNRLSPSLQQGVARITTSWQPEVCWKTGFFSVLFCNCIFYTGNYFVVFCKTKHSSPKYLNAVSVDKFQCSPHMKAIIVYYLKWRHSKLTLLFLLVTCINIMVSLLILKIFLDEIKGFMYKLLITFVNFHKK